MTMDVIIFAFIVHFVKIKCWVKMEKKRVFGTKKHRLDRVNQYTNVFLLRFIVVISTQCIYHVVL